MAWSSQELGAIGRYAKMHGLKLALSNRPKVNFIDKDGKQITVDIMTVNREAEVNKKEEATERRRIATNKRREEESARWKRQY